MRLGTLGVTPVRLAVVGGSQFQEMVLLAAPRIGGTVVAGINPDGTEALAAEVARARQCCDEFVIEATAVPAFSALDDDVIGTTRAIRVVRSMEAAVGLDDLLAPALSPFKAAAKRTFDLVVACVTLLVMLPVFALAALAVRLETPGPVLFRQTRLGAFGRPFTMFKLRTMQAENDDSEHIRYVHALIEGATVPHGGIFKLADDPRITRVGRVLRRYSVDELPQLVNVIRGEMSLVGPRPPLPREVKRYDARAWGRLRGKPGITGLWQVSGRCQLTFSEMVELDLEYLQRSALWLDLLILLRTPLTALTGRGAA